MPVVCSQVQIKDRKLVQSVVVSIVEVCTNEVLVSGHQGSHGVAIPRAIWKGADIIIAPC
uniref:Uncharacterized protein n=1 Tax=Arundo donax TaxID=35708 RepID=A0A0A9FQ78_ARUDO